MSDGDSFGVQLRELRMSAGLTQRELAERSGMSIRAIANLEHERTRAPYKDSARRLCDALGLDGPAKERFVAAARRPSTLDGLTTEKTPATAVTEDAGGYPVVPHQLPAAVVPFVGRRDQLAALTKSLASSGTAAIGGTAGVGKTALATQWAYQSAASFPDGQLFVNLRGFDPSSDPLTPADAVRVLLDALQVPAHRLPQTLDGQLGLYRSLLAGKRMLIVLDNARSTAQVRPLLPGSPGCRVIVTSRNLLTGLAAVEAARPVLLDVLSPDEAQHLLDQRLGADRLAAEPVAATQIIQSSARLPLALSVIAARAAMRPDLSMTRIAADLRASQNLDAFSTGEDPAADVRAALSWSYKHLEGTTAQAFRLAGRHPGRVLDAYNLAALAGSSATDAERALDALTRACLVQPMGQDRYGMHDLLRSYAREVGTHQSGAGETTALTRLLEYYLYAAATAVGILFPGWRHRLPQVPEPATPIPTIASAPAARAWLDSQRPNLVAVTVHAAEHGWPSHATRLSTILFFYFYTGAHASEAFAVHSSAYRIARATNDRAAEAAALNWLSAWDCYLTDYPQAMRRLRQAVSALEDAGDLVGRANALANLGFVEICTGNGQSAVSHLAESLAVLRGADDKVAEAGVLTNLGVAALRQGRYQEAMDYLDEALALCHKIGEIGSTVHTLANLGEVHLRLGSYRQATAHLNKALIVCQTVGDRRNVADVLALLGLVDLRQRRYQRAMDHLNHALSLSRQTHDMRSLAAAHNGLGELSLACGSIDAAESHHTAALAAASQAAERYETARAHHGLARTYQENGHENEARIHLQAAHAQYAALGSPEAEHIGAHQHERAE
jgi:tetratricopeptide (TPR) repeat protein/transcriptional regulator with XRE-family HTH domain